jgi:hypothetical protein
MVRKIARASLALSHFEFELAEFSEVEDAGRRLRRDNLLWAREALRSPSCMPPAAAVVEDAGRRLCWDNLLWESLVRQPGEDFFWVGAECERSNLTLSRGGGGGGGGGGGILSPFLNRDPSADGFR